MTKKSRTLISKVYKDPQYEGRHIIIIGDQIYARKTGVAKSKLLETLIKKYPKKKPIVAYIPKEDALILSL